MQLTVITPDKEVFNGTVTSVTVPGSAGTFEILKSHAAIISTLEDGKIIIRNNKDVQVIEIVGGVVEVLDDVVTVLAERIPQN